MIGGLPCGPNTLDKLELGERFKPSPQPPIKTHRRASGMAALGISRRYERKHALGIIQVRLPFLYKIEGQPRAESQRLSREEKTPSVGPVYV